MSSTKTAYFGSLFAITHSGVDQLVDRIRSNYPEDPASAPFVAYDHDKNLLSCSIDRNDTGTTQFLLAQLKLFIDQENKKPQVIEPAIRPLEGALVRTEIDYSNTRHEAAGLVDVGVNGYHPGNDPLKALQHVTTYWVPEGGEIKILTTAIAEKIASLTACSIYPEPLEARVRLVGGDFNAALKKLQNLEPLLGLQYQQRQFVTLKTNANVLLRTTSDPNPVMEFERLNNPDHAAYHRVIVRDGQQVLQGKCLCELRIPGVPKEESIPQNLMLVGVTDTNMSGESAVWNRFTYETLGDERSKNPRNQSAVDNSDKSTISLSSKVGHNEYLEPSKVARVAEWSGQVDEKVDPNTVAPEAPEQGSTRRRRVAVDSDDEDDEQQDVAHSTSKATTAQPLPRLISPQPQDAESRLRDASAAPSVLASDLLKSEVAETNKSMIPTVPNLLVAAPPSPAEGMVTSYRTRVVRPGSDSGTHSTYGEPVRLSEVAYSSIAPVASGTTVAKPLAAEPSNASISAEYSQAGRDSEEPRMGSQLSANPKPFEDAPAFKNIDGTSPATTKTSTAVQPIVATIPFRESSPDRLSTSVSLPSKSFDPKAYGPKPRSARGSHSSSNTSPTTKAAVALRAKPITIPSQQTSPDRLASQIVSGGFTPTTTKHPKPFPLASYRGSSPPNSKDSGKSGGRKRGTRHRGLSGTKKAAQGPQDIDDQSADSIGDLKIESQPVTNGAPVQTNGKRGDRPQPATSEEYGDLIDVSDDGGSSPNQSPPPPGFDLRIQPIKEKSGSPMSNFIDEPLQARRPTSRATNSDLISFSSGSRMPPTSGVSRASDESASYVNTVAYKGPNISALKNNTLARLKAMQAKKKEREQQGEAAKALAQAQIGPRPKLDNQNQPFRSTMNLQASNPGKKGLPKQESKAEKRKRQEQALREAYGLPAPLIPHKPGPDLFDISRQKHQLQSSSANIAVASPEALQVESRQQATEGLVAGLAPIVEATRAFCGDLHLEFQLGQLLISSDSGIREKTVTPKKWEKLFGTTAKSPILTSFTAAMTRNGADVDRALEVKASKGGKLWDTSSPGPESIHYVFECQSKHGDQLLLVLDQSGHYELRNSNATILGMVGLHCPAQVWDACAVVYGNEKWSSSTEVEATVRSFVATIHVLPNRRELVLVFRQPDDNELMIKNVSMRRVSVHQCLLLDYRNYQLQTMEVKTLYTKVHPEDKKLWQAFEKSHVDMMQDGLVHYELSVIDKSINEVFSGNRILELGELASPSAGRQLLNGDRIKKLVDLTAHMVSKIDWMGSRNNGTLARAAAVRADQMIRQQQSLPPIARSRLNPLVSASRIDPSSRHGGGSAYPMSSAGGTEVFIGRRPVPGTRYGTLAEVYEDEHGMFAKGYGGARVPVGENSVLGAISEAPLEPDDSASQMGMVGRRGGLASGVGAGRGAFRGVGIHGNKGPGFW